MAQLQVRDLYLSFGGLTALNGISLSVNSAEIFAIIGPNGAGKTCILNCICRFYHPDQGSVTFEGQEITNFASHKVAGLGIARTFQNIELFQGMTVLDAVLEAGSVTLYADANDTKLYRRTETGAATYDIHLKDILENGDMRTNVMLMPGDVITVPERLF